MRLKRLISTFLVVCMMLIVLPLGTLNVSACSCPAAKPLPNDLWNPAIYPTQRDRIVAVALSQKDYKEAEENLNAYSCEEFGYHDEWCAAFISWCARKAGISTNIIKSTLWAGEDRSEGSSYDKWFYDGKKEPYFNIKMRLPSSNYVPQKGDIVWIETDNPQPSGWYDGSDHVGLVIGTDTNDSNYTKIYTIEGNADNSVMKMEYNRYDKECKKFHSCYWRT